MSDDNHRWTLRVLVYVALVASAGTAFAFGDRMWDAVAAGHWPVWAAMLAPALFAVFVLVYGADRWMLVRRGRTALGRAFIQVAFAVIFMTFLLQQQAHHYRHAQENLRARDYAVDLLKHRDERVRAAACELIGLRAQLDAYEQVQKLAAGDRAPHVRAICGQALVRLSTAADFDRSP